MLNRQHFQTAILLVIAIVLLTSFGSAEPQGRLVIETYIVKSGDTLDAISYRFIAKSSVRRDIREFRESIIELNWDTVFKDRQPYGLIHPGDRLQINYWKEDAN